MQPNDAVTQHGSPFHRLSPCWELSIQLEEVWQPGFNRITGPYNKNQQTFFIFMPTYKRDQKKKTKGKRKTCYHLFWQRTSGNFISIFILINKYHKISAPHLNLQHLSNSHLTVINHSCFYSLLKACNSTKHTRRHAEYGHFKGNNQCDNCHKFISSYFFLFITNMLCLHDSKYFYKETNVFTFGNKITMCVVLLNGEVAQLIAYFNSQH